MTKRQLLMKGKIQANRRILKKHQIVKKRQILRKREIATKQSPLGCETALGPAGRRRGSG